MNDCVILWTIVTSTSAPAGRCAVGLMLIVCVSGCVRSTAPTGTPFTVALTTSPDCRVVASFTLPDPSKTEASTIDLRIETTATKPAVGL